MSDLISKKDLICHIEKEYAEWGEEYDALQILGDIKDFKETEETTVELSEQKPVAGKLLFMIVIDESNNKVMPVLGGCNYDGEWFIQKKPGRKLEKMEKTYRVLAWANTARVKREISVLFSRDQEQKEEE